MTTAAEVLKRKAGNIFLLANTKPLDIPEALLLKIAGMNAIINYVYTISGDMN